MRRKVRTLFLSDIHLGYRRARVKELFEFLTVLDAQQIVLVGDIVDASSLSERFYWSEEHSRIVRSLLAKRRAGARIIFIPGNHDAPLSMLAELVSGPLEVHREWVHRTARGARLLVLHGDRFDDVASCPPWLSRLGDALYYVVVAVSGGLNDLRRRVGKPYMPLAETIKLSVGLSVRFIEAYERRIARHARAEGYDGVVCGHIHRANLRQIEGALYCNTGDWVESCTALVESLDGQMQLLRWPSSFSGAAHPSPGLALDVA